MSFCETGDGEESKAPPISPFRTTLTSRVKIVLFFVHFANAVVQFILAAAAPSTFDFNATIVSFMRDGPPDASMIPGYTISDVGTVSVPYIFAAANLFAALGILFCIFYSESELQYVGTGRMPYVWAALFLSGIPLRFATELTAGIGDYQYLILAFLATTAVYFIYWLVTHTHVFGVETPLIRAFYIAILLLLIVVRDTLLIVAAVDTAVGGGPTIHLMPPAALVLFDMLPLAAVLIGYLGWLWPHTVMMVIYCIMSLAVIVVSWLGFVSFATDGITYP